VIATILRQAGLAVEVHDDHFPPDARDVDWLRAVGETGWIVLTKDERIRYRRLEKQTLLASGVRSFVLTGRDLKAAEMAAVFLAALPKMRKLLERKPGPFIACVTRHALLRIVED